MPARPRSQAGRRGPKGADWAGIDHDYQFTALTLDELAARHGSSKPSICRHAKNLGLKRGVAEVVRQRTQAELTRQAAAKLNEAANEAEQAIARAGRLAGNPKAQHTPDVGDEQGAEHGGSAPAQSGQSAPGALSGETAKPQQKRNLSTETVNKKRELLSERRTANALQAQLAETEREVDIAVAANMLVLARHSEFLASLYEEAEQMAAELTAARVKAPDLYRAAAILAEGMDPMQRGSLMDMVKRAAGLGGRVNTLKALTETVAKIIPLEREANGIDAEPPPPEDSWEKHQELLADFEARRPVAPAHPSAPGALLPKQT